MKHQTDSSRVLIPKLSKKTILNRSTYVYRDYTHLTAPAGQIKKDKTIMIRLTTDNYNNLQQILHNRKMTITDFLTSYIENEINKEINKNQLEIFEVLEQA